MSLRAGLRLRLLMLMTMLPSTFGAVDMSLAVVFSTRIPQGNQGLPIAVILFGNPEVYIAELNNQTSDVSYQQAQVYGSTPIPPSLSSGPVEVDYRRGALCWSNELQQSLTLYPYILHDSNNYTSYQSTAANLSSQVTGLALDWVANRLYWSDAGYQRIGVIDTITFMTWQIVVATNLSSPQDVVVYPQQNYLFWSDAGSTPKIERLDLTTSIRTVLVSNATVLSPKTLVIDYVSLRLYWLDTGKGEVGSVNLDGSGYIPWQSSLFLRISSFFIYKQYFAFADQFNFVVYIFNGNQSVYNYTNSQGSGISDMVTFDPTRQPNITTTTTTTTAATTTSGAATVTDSTLTTTTTTSTSTTSTTTTTPSTSASATSATTTTASTTAISAIATPTTPSAATSTTTTNTAATTTSGSGGMKGGKLTMAMFFTVLGFMKIRASATN